MILIGSNHVFSDLEKKRISPVYGESSSIPSTGEEAKKIIAKIEQSIEKDDSNLVVINSRVVRKQVIDYLEDKVKRDAVSVISIESLLENELKKVKVRDLDYKSSLDLSKNVCSYSPFQTIQKRVIDYIGVFFLVFLFWPFIVYSMYRIKKESPEGPLFFKQLRVGYDGKEFECIKFRSMKMDAEENGAQFAEEDDPRVFKWGRVMRKTRIDELPQVINILRGDMHFVGPRPERKVWTDQFDKNIPHYSDRHKVKPGITGWAQVMYPYGVNEEDAHQKLMYDLYYMKHWNIFLELETIFRTVMVVLGRGGY